MVKKIIFGFFFLVGINAFPQSALNTFQIDPVSGRYSANMGGIVTSGQFAPDALSHPETLRELAVDRYNMINDPPRTASGDYVPYFDYNGWVSTLLGMYQAILSMANDVETRLSTQQPARQQPTQGQSSCDKLIGAGLESTCR